MACTLLIVVDAFSSNYLGYGCTPNLARLYERNLLVRRLMPGFTFCEIAQFLTGANSTKTGMFTQFSYGKSKSEYGFLKPIFKTAGLVSSHNKSISHIMHTTLDMLLGKVGFKYLTYEIPLDLIHNFYLVEAGRSYYEPGAFGVESIIDVMNKSGKSLFKDTFVEYNRSKGNDQTRVQGFMSVVEKQHYDLYMLYLGVLDNFGHFYGPESMKIHTALRLIDYQIGSMVEFALRKNPKTNIIIIGDHGMSPVHHYIDVVQEFRRLRMQSNIVCGKDYIPFIDSTMCRIWTKHEEVKILLVESFQRMKHGFLLDKRLSKKLEIPEPGPQIGELVWVCSDGTVIYPDYFHVNEAVRGMHGYATNSNVHNGLAIVISPQVRSKIIEEAKLMDICPTICDLMDMRYPQQNQGKSVIE